MFSNYGAKHLVVKRLNIMTFHYNLYLQGAIMKFLGLCSCAKDISILLGYVLKQWARIPQQSSTTSEKN